MRPQVFRDCLHSVSQPSGSDGKIDKLTANNTNARYARPSVHVDYYVECSFSHQCIRTH